MFGHAHLSNFSHPSQHYSRAFYKAPDVMSVCRQCVSGVPAPRCHDDKSAGGVPRTGVDPDGTCELLQTNRADFLTAPKPPRETASETREARVTFPTPTPARIPSPNIHRRQGRSPTLKIAHALSRSLNPSAGIPCPTHSHTHRHHQTTENVAGSPRHGTARSSSKVMRHPDMVEMYLF